MKINSINNNFNNNRHNTGVNKQNKENHPAFGARVAVNNVIKDVISGEIIDISQGPLNALKERIIPYLHRLEDDNLLVTISGTEKKRNILDIFKDKMPQGLKFDLRYIDAKKFYNKFMADRELPKFVHPDVIKGLRRKDEPLMEALSETICVGKIFRPDKGETAEQYIDEVIPKLHEHLRIMPKIVTERNDIKFDPNIQRYTKLAPADPSARNPWNYYRGIEFDYDTIGFTDIPQIV